MLKVKLLVFKLAVGLAIGVGHCGQYNGISTPLMVRLLPAKAKLWLGAPPPPLLGSNAVSSANAEGLAIDAQGLRIGVGVDKKVDAVIANLQLVAIQHHGRLLGGLPARLLKSMLLSPTCRTLPSGERVRPPPLSLFVAVDFGDTSPTTGRVNL